MLIEINNPGAFKSLVAVLNNGGLAIMPCDTIYGIVGIAPDTEDRINRLKGRKDKNLIQLINSVDRLKDFSDVVLPEILKEFWPGPLTLIFPVKKDRKKKDRKQMRTVALRIPEDPFLYSVLENLNHPLFSTSINKSGQKPLWRIREIITAFASDVDLILCAGDLPSRLPSTILDISTTPYRLVRSGAVRLPDSIFS